MATPHRSLWLDSPLARPLPRLDQDLDVDVVVVGAGIVGITTAYLLQRSGRSVAVLERDRVGSGVTGHTTAKLTFQHGGLLHKIARFHSRERAQEYVEANQQGFHQTLSLIDALGSDVGLTRTPTYVYATDPEQRAALQEEASLATDFGLEAELVDDTELPFSIEGALRYDGQATIHPIRYLLRLVERAQAEGVQLYEKSPVRQIKEGRPCTVQTDEASVRAGHVVVATNVPIGDRMHFVTRMTPRRHYGIASEAGQADLQGAYISMGSPTRSMRPVDSEDGPRMVFVTGSHVTGHDEDTERWLRDLERYAKHHFAAGPITHRWSSQDFDPTEHLPMVGRMRIGARHVFTATGFQGWGLTNGTAAAHLLHDLILGQEHPHADLYDPFRGGRLLKDVADPGTLKTQGHMAKMMVKDHLRKETLQQLAPGHGGIAEVNGQKVAIHKTDDGALVIRSAKCTHMGCTVAWNSSESSWDCHCHGSRFDVDGTVLHGPASAPLARVDDDLEEDAGAQVEPHAER